MQRLFKSSEECRWENIFGQVGFPGQGRYQGGKYLELYSYPHYLGCDQQDGYVKRLCGCVLE